MSRLAITEALKDQIGRKCANCGTTEELTYHHIVPLVFGGNDIVSNMVCLCAKCHNIIHHHRDIPNHPEAVKQGIANARVKGVHVGRKPCDYERVIRLIAENSTQFNEFSETTETEIMHLAGVKPVCYYKCKRMLFEAMQNDVWPYSFRKPAQVREHPLYERVIVKARGEYKHESCNLP